MISKTCWIMQWDIQGKQETAQRITIEYIRSMLIESCKKEKKKKKKKQIKTRKAAGLYRKTTNGSVSCRTRLTSTASSIFAYAIRNDHHILRNVVTTKITWNTVHFPRNPRSVCQKPRIKANYLLSFVAIEPQKSLLYSGGCTPSCDDCCSSQTLLSCRSPASNQDTLATA